jgi:hypothetical protein
MRLARAFERERKGGASERERKRERGRERQQQQQQRSGGCLCANAPPLVVEAAGARAKDAPAQYCAIAALLWKKEGRRDGRSEEKKRDGAPLSLPPLSLSC